MEPRNPRIRFGQLAMLVLLCAGLGGCAGDQSNATPQLGLPQPAAVPIRMSEITLPPSAPTASSNPSPSLAPTSTLRTLPKGSPTPVVHWAVEAITVQGQSKGIGYEPGWESNTLARLGHYMDAYSRTGRTVVDLSAGPAAQPTAIPDPPKEEVYSPHQTYLIRCSDRLQLYRVSDQQLLSETAVTPPLSPGITCSVYVRWAPDESAVAFVARRSDDGKRTVYVWHTDGSAPKQVADGCVCGSVAWANDSRRLVFDSTDPNTGESMAVVIDSEGRAQAPPFNIGRGYHGESATLTWFADDVVANGVWHWGLYLFQASTGQYLLYLWDDSPVRTPWHAFPTISPNQRWITLDRSDFASDDQAVQKRYSVFDVQTKTEFVLADSRDTYLEFKGWKDDSSVLYLVSRPAHPTSNSDPNTSFGLLAFNPLTQKSEVLFKEAVKVEWNADKSRAFVVFPARQPDGALGLAGGIWKVGSTELVGRQLLAKQMLFLDPLRQPGRPSDNLPAAWSHDGTRVVFGSPQGVIMCLNINGTRLQLTNDFPVNQWDEAIFKWSPDDRHLLVEYGDRAWIATLP